MHLLRGIQKARMVAFVTLVPAFLCGHKIALQLEFANVFAKLMDVVIESDDLERLVRRQ